jgi:hypothetical protein
MSKKDKNKEINEIQASAQENDNSSSEKKDKKEKKKSAKPKKTINKRKLKYGSVATAITVVFIAVIVLVNVLVTSLTERYPLKLDLTSNKAFEVSQETIDFLGNLSKEVNIAVMEDESDLELGSSYDKQLVEVVKKYSQNSDKVNVEFIDMDKNPNYVSKYNDMYKGEISTGNIVVTSGEKIKVLTASELYNTESYYYYSYITSSKAEQALTSAVMYVTDENPKKIAFLSVTSTSSVQASLDNFKSTLESNGYDIEDIDLMSVEKIDESYDMIVIPAPLNDFTASMTEKLSDYLYNDGNLGKNIFYMANYDQNNTPNIDEFLSEWGIEIGDGYIYETDNNLKQIAPVYGMQNYISASVAQITEDETFSGLLSDESLPIIVPVSRPINLLFETDNDKETMSILTTSDTSAVIPVDADSSYDISESEMGVQNVMVKSSKYVFDDNNEKVTSNIVAIGSSFLVDYYMLSESAYNNGEFMINAINTVTGKSNGITIVAKSLDAETITISESQTNVLTTVLVFIIPAIVVIIGFTVFIRRKNR